MAHNSHFCGRNLHFFRQNLAPIVQDLSCEKALPLHPAAEAALSRGKKRRGVKRPGMEKNVIPIPKKIGIGILPKMVVNHQIGTYWHVLIPLQKW